MVIILWEVRYFHHLEDGAVLITTDLVVLKEVDGGGLGLKKLCGLGFEGIFSYLLESLRLMVGLLIEGQTSDVRIKVFTE